MAVGEEFSEPRTVKRGEVVMDQLVELLGPRSVEVLVLIGVVVVLLAVIILGVGVAVMMMLCL